MFKPIFVEDKAKLHQVIKELITESRVDRDFYFMLSVSTVIVTLGIIENSIIALIGGMVVAPLLSPLLVVGLATTTASKKSFGWILPNLLKAIILVMAIAFVVSFLFDGDKSAMISSFRPNLNMFMIALAAGAGGAYAWIRKEVSAIIPGIAISVSLLPPLVASAIGISMFSGEVVSSSFALFFINFLGIIFSSIIVFLMFGIGTLQEEEEKVVMKETEADERDKS
ncbi:MAG: DUF389 domain-containing protein [Candidatus Colwellbacteria bacterium]|nr:DUF389 domain-containing protein [Candidatus Colwellbacteria bacterium]